eukprot:6181155-Pleurochrysis_carterae.AAC.2
MNNRKTGPEGDGLNTQVAKVGNLLLDDIFDEMTLPGRNQDGSPSVRKADGRTIDRTTGHLRRKRYAHEEPPHVVGGAYGLE